MYIFPYFICFGFARAMILDFQKQSEVSDIKNSEHLAQTPKILILKIQLLHKSDKR